MLVAVYVMSHVTSCERNRVDAECRFVRTILIFCKICRHVDDVTFCQAIQAVENVRDTTHFIHQSAVAHGSRSASQLPLVPLPKERLLCNLFPSFKFQGTLDHDLFFSANRIKQ
jgi:hypothetical protein